MPMRLPHPGAYQPTLSLSLHILQTTSPQVWTEKNEGDETQAQYFVRDVDLRKIFNILNGHHDDGTIPHEDYNAIRERLKRGLAGADVSFEGINSLLNLLEATTSSVPSSTNRAQLVDVSLYDHAKTTAGIAACI